MSVRLLVVYCDCPSERRPANTPESGALCSRLNSGQFVQVGLQGKLIDVLKSVFIELRDEIRHDEILFHLLVSSLQSASFGGKKRLATNHPKVTDTLVACLASRERRVLSNTFHLSGDTFHISPRANFAEGKHVAALRNYGQMELFC